MLKFRSSGLVLFSWVALLSTCSRPGPNPDTDGADASASSGQALTVAGSRAVWLVLKEKANLSPPLSVSSWRGRGQFVYDQPPGTAARTKPPLHGRLKSRGLKYQSF